MLLIGTKWIIPDYGDLYQYQRPDKLHPVPLSKQQLPCSHGLKPWDIIKGMKTNWTNEHSGQATVGSAMWLLLPELP